ncbi:MAG: endolytic transglycosylase MltG [Legionella sp.]|nr:endolytic transglycosylase MltG [Legionella sp.]
MHVPNFKPWLYSILGLGLVALLIFIYSLYTQLTQPMIVAGRPVIIEIKPNSTASALIQTLHSKKLISSKRLFLNLIKYKNLAHKLKAGIYQITPGESAQQFIYRVVAGDVLSPTFRITEGSTLSQISINLKNAPFLNYSSNDWAAIAGNNPSGEGLLLADTYQYIAGSNAQDLLKTANTKLLRYLEERWQERSPNLPYKTPYEMLIAASIIEKETALASERKIISGVIINRLNKNMPLQMDPTVIYALGTNYTGKLTHKNLAVDSPYNTYLYRGLPPTPIAMVGKESIDAAAQPIKTNYLYFVAKGDGSHVFSETYDEQKKAILRYLSKGS